jgi:hypothetical protein
MHGVNRRKARQLQRQFGELMVAAPQVVTHRLGRLAVAGPRPGPHDRREFQRMGIEKLEAFGESWQAMTRQWLKSHQQLATALWQGHGPLSAPGRRASPAFATKAAAAWQQAALDLLGQGLRPVHRRAVANARRLGRRRAR